MMHFPSDTETMHLFKELSARRTCFRKSRASRGNTKPPRDGSVGGVEPGACGPARPERKAPSLAHGGSSLPPRVSGSPAPAAWAPGLHDHGRRHPRGGASVEDGRWETLAFRYYVPSPPRDRTRYRGLSSLRMSLSQRPLGIAGGRAGGSAQLWTGTRV